LFSALPQSPKGSGHGSVMMIYLSLVPRLFAPSFLRFEVRKTDNDEPEYEEEYDDDEYEEE